MAFGSGSGVRVAYIAESVFGTTPTTPVFKVLRTTGGSLRTNKGSVTTNERQIDRNVRDEFMVSKEAGGAYDFELTYGTFDDLLEGLMQSTWSTNVLKNGITTKSFTVEETLELGTTDSYSRFRGAMVDTFSLNVGAQEAVTGNIGFRAVEETLATAIVAGATYTSANTNPVSTASAHVASLSVTTSPALSAQPRVRRVTLEVSNNLRVRPEVGSIFSAEFGSGRFELTGTMEAYFESNEIYQKVLDHGSGALSFTVGNTAGSKYTILVPKFYFGDGERAVGGNDDDVIITIPWRGVYDTTEACTLKITRAI